MNEKIRQYIDSVVPEGLDKQKRTELCDELECHIFDIIDDYEEIGYTYEQSVDIALEKMGEDSKIKKEIKDNFDELHHEETIWAIWVCIGLVFFNLFLALFGVMVYFPIEPEPLSIYFGGVSISFVITNLLFKYIDSLIKKNYSKSLKGVAVAHLIIALLPAYPQHSFGALIYNLAYLNDYFGNGIMNETYEKYRVYAYVASVIYCLAVAGICMYVSNTKRERKKKIRKISTVSFGVILLLLLIINETAFVFADNYNNKLDYEFFHIIGFSVNDSDRKICDELITYGDYDIIYEKLKEYGYVNTEEYKENLNQHELKYFDRKTQQWPSIFNNDYEIWFYDDKYIVDFIYLKKDSKNKVTEIRTGESPDDFENLYDTSSYSSYFSISEMMNLKTGSSEADILEICDQSSIYSYCVKTKNAKIEKQYQLYYNDYYDSTDSSSENCYYVTLKLKDDKLCDKKAFVKNIRYSKTNEKTETVSELF